MERGVHESDLAMMISYAGEEDRQRSSAEELHRTADRLQERTERLSGRTRELRQSAKRLKAATKRLRDRLASSFPPPSPDSTPKT
jgi:hypothetical protein